VDVFWRGRVSRNANGDGSVWQRKNGRWCAAAYLPVVTGGRRRVVTYGKNRREAHLSADERGELEHRAAGGDSPLSLAGAAGTHGTGTDASAASTAWMPPPPHRRLPRVRLSRPVTGPESGLTVRTPTRIPCDRWTGARVAWIASPPGCGEHGNGSWCTGPARQPGPMRPPASTRSDWNVMAGIPPASAAVASESGFDLDRRGAKGWCRATAGWMMHVPCGCVHVARALPETPLLRLRGLICPAPLPFASRRRRRQ